MRIVRLLVATLAGLVLLGLAVFFGARFHDGPLSIIPGGPLVAGEAIDTPTTDWSFAKDVGEIELQLDSQSRSRTTWILVRDGTAWIPCNLSFPPGKRWYREAERDGRARLRIDGRLYRVDLKRDDDPTLREFARPEVERKYGAAPPGGGSVLYFKVTSRS